jgi:hypothetical protein
VIGEYYDTGHQTTVGVRWHDVVISDAPDAWKCFHCGETFDSRGAARDHFGFDPSSDPACRIKLGAERGLVMALRKAEAELAQYTRLFHDENLEAYRLLAAARSQHAEQLRIMEELGYERGLADGRALATEDAARLTREPPAPVAIEAVV